MGEPFRILILCDVQNVYYGAKNFTNDDSTRRADYKAIREHLVSEAIRRHGHQPVDVEAYAYVVQTPKYQNMQFFAFLRSCEYYLKVRHCDPKQDRGRNNDGSVGSMMQLDLLDMATEFHMVIVVSGSGIFGPAFHAIKNNWPDVITGVSAFRNTLHHVYTGDDSPVDEVILLDERVIEVIEDGGE